MKPLAAVALIAGMALGACSDLNSTQQRTLTGGAAGAAGGAAIGALTGGSAVGGALLGGAAGAGGGYLYDRSKRD
ncbi:hypothetical protein AUP43_09455 [Oceanibaculum pacificum]|uniref:Glycine zipper domain-containing protein n=2 Tax=Oceanibaculum pacificum TaxID=580166 RepID=A0A154W362_9PROT|nr:hypothetical protein AUP43_09455 [Oceanibaculum pacificum]